MRVFAAITGPGCRALTLSMSLRAQRSNLPLSGQYRLPRRYTPRNDKDASFRSNDRGVLLIVAHVNIMLKNARVQVSGAFTRYFPGRGCKKMR